MTRLIDADNLSIHKFIIAGTYEPYAKGWNDAIDAIIDNELTYEFTGAICSACKYVDVQTNRKPCCSCRWLPRESHFDKRTIVYDSERRKDNDSKRTNRGIEEV